MANYKIFLASSAELREDRREFEIFINRKNKDWAQQGVFLELVIWEDFGCALSTTRLQDEYNEAIRTADIFVMLFCTKVGQYTAEEFDTAFAQFQATGKPLLFTYFKDAGITTGSANKEALLSLWAFQEKLDQLGHFYTKYQNTSELKLDFNGQLDTLAAEGFIHFTLPQAASQNGLKIPHALTRPPFLPEVFIGRREELQTIHAKLSGGGNLLLLVNGEGGIGKTSLAATYYHTYQPEYHHTAWVLSEKNIASALLSLAEPLGLRFEETMPAAGRLDILLRALAELPTPCLLVIDNANEAEDLEKNYQNLRCLPNFHILLTTRITEFSQAERYQIDGLPEAEALELFRKYYPEHETSDDGLFQKIRTAIGGNTLVIELLAKNLHMFNRLGTKYTLADLLLDLQRRGLLNLSHSRMISTDYHGGGGMRSEKLEEIIAAIYDLSQLTPPGIGLLSVFAVLPAESIPFEILTTVLPKAEDLEPTLVSLAQKGWIEHNPAACSFKCSPVVQEITKKSNQRLLEDCRTLIGTLINKLDYEPGIGHLMNATYEEAALFARYAESVTRAFAKANEGLAILCERIGSYHRTTGNLDQALGFYEEYRRLEQELYEADPNNVSFKNNMAISYEKLGDTQTALGNLDQALGFYEDYRRLEQELYEAYPNNVSFKNGLAISYFKLGNTQTALGNLDQALRFYEDETDLFKELYEAYPNNVSFKNGLAVSYSKLGQTQTALGKLDQALGFYEADLKLTKELYEANPNNVSFKDGLAVSYQMLGNAQTTLGNLDQALGFYEDYRRLEQELNEAHPNNVSFKNGLAISYSKLGETQTALGNLDQALGFYEDYRRLEQELYEAYPNNVSFKNNLAISYYKLGAFYKDKKKDKKKARAWFQKAEKIWVELVGAAPRYAEFQRNLAIVQKVLKQL